MHWMRCNAAVQVELSLVSPNVYKNTLSVVEKLVQRRSYTAILMLTACIPRVLNCRRTLRTNHSEKVPSPQLRVCCFGAVSVKPK